MHALVVLLGLAACSGEDPAPAPTPVPAVEPAPRPVAAPAAPAAPSSGVFDVATLNAQREANVGKTVQVRGYLNGVTKQSSPPSVNLSVGATDKAGSDSVLCVASVADEAAITAITLKSEVTVVGTVDKEAFFGDARLTGCALAGAGGDAPAAGRGEPEGGGGGGGAKAGKGKKAR